MSTIDEALEAFRRGDAESARRIVKAVLDANPQDLEALMWLAEISDDVSEQRDALLRALAIDPLSSEVRRALLRHNRAPSAQTVTTTTNAQPIITPSSPASVQREEADAATNAVDGHHSSPADRSPTGREGDEPREAEQRRRNVRWIEPIRSEAEIPTSLPSYIAKLDAMVTEAGLDAARISPRLNAVVQRIATEDDRQRGFAVCDAAVVAADVAELLLKRDRFADAFFVANTFTEVLKIYMLRNRDLNRRTTDRLVTVACDAAVHLLDEDMPIAEVATILDRLTARALGTQYLVQKQRFVTTHVDQGFVNRVVTDALVRHFDRRLAILVERDRPRLSDFVNANMPVVYRLPMAPQWLARRDDWEASISAAGYEDLIRHLTSVGELVRPDVIGQVSPERREDIRRAADTGDHGQVRKLLEGSERELKQYLYAEAQTRLDFRAPSKSPQVANALRADCRRAVAMSQSGRRDDVAKALAIMKSLWEREIQNYELRDWVAYLEARTGNTPLAEQHLTQIHGLRDVRDNFATDWNLAVVLSQRREDDPAYKMLLPFLDFRTDDEALVLVLLALSHRLGDFRRFLDIVPNTRTLRFHPLAFCVAVDVKDERAKDFLADMLNHWRSKWELPHLSTQYVSEADLKKVVDRAIVEGQVDQAISWLRARIQNVRGWIPNYRVLAQLLERERQDADGAFAVLAAACGAIRVDANRPQSTSRRDAAFRELLDFCRYTKREDLRDRAIDLARKAHVNEGILRAFASTPRAPLTDLAAALPPTPVAPPRAPVSTEPPPARAADLAWLTATLARIKNVASFTKERPAIEKFRSMVVDMFPTESTQLAEWLNSLAIIINSFSELRPDAYAERRVQHDRAFKFERDLSRHLTSGVLPQQLADIMTPYHEALKRVLGDLSRQAGIGPQIKSTVLNQFIAPDAARTTIALQIQNASEQPVTDVHVEMRLEGNVATIVNARQGIPRLEPGETSELSFDMLPEQRLRNTSEVTVDVSLQASADGFPNVDLGVAQGRVQIRRLQDVIGSESIPKLFNVGQALRPNESALFQGREDVLNRIRNSIYAGVQRERLFLDGIRRVGKTSVLNFVPLHMPDDVLSIDLKLEALGVVPPLDPTAFLRLICEQVSAKLTTVGIAAIPVPDGSGATGLRSLATYLAGVRAATGKTPLLIFDEFQRLLEAIAATGGGAEVILDVLRAALEDGSMYGLFTGSVRFDRLSAIVKHRIFGNLTRLRVSFLNAENVGKVLRAGFNDWVQVTEAAVRRVHELTGGYPWLVQSFGSNLVDLLNDERRTVATSADVDRVNRDRILVDNSLFEHWWPAAQLGRQEERFVEFLFQQYPGAAEVSVRDFLERVDWREQQSFRRALDNLRACEVIDSTEVDTLRFSGIALRQWLELQMQDGRLHIQISTVIEVKKPSPGQIGIFVDHENLVKTLDRITISRHQARPTDRRDWFSRCLTNILAEAERRVGPLHQKVAVAFWNRPNEATLTSPYVQQEFVIRQPEDVKQDNAVDFKLADEVRRTMGQAAKEGSHLQDAIIVTGDGDFSHLVSGLKNDHVRVHIWAGSQSLNPKLRELVGDDRVVDIADVCGM
ncbi:MAG TPA: NYN domain-containing protein [Thermoanaerobaculia bacterium]|jgi:hypothetical protein|nr:NYN domain-containing protein [Thermoanaerobaculia bacterium]